MSKIYGLVFTGVLFCNRGGGVGPHFMVEAMDAFHSVV